MSEQTSFENILMDEVIPIPEGKYEGQISGVKRSDEKSDYDYIRYSVDFDLEGEQKTLEVSFPVGITFLKDGTPSSQHAKFLNVFDIEFVKDKKFSEIIDQVLKQNMSFLVEQKTTTKGTYSNIVKTSIKKV